MNNAVMIGLPGSGKTTFGKRLARELGMEFIDTDQLITESEKVTIANIFETKGEDYFRDLETHVLRMIKIETQKSNVAGKGIILSVGGGVPMRQENVDLMKEIGIVVYIDRSIDEIVQDIRITEGRPLLKDKEAIRELESSRRDVYEKCADKIVYNEGSYEEVLVKLTSICTLLGMGSKYCVIGDPIQHSLSPRMHSIVFKKLKLDETYRKVKIKQEYLSKCMADVRMGELEGFNVTKPHKVSIIEYLDELASDAKIAGAVNTVKIKDKRMIGYNTDMQGLCLAVNRMGKEYKDARVTILGTGGAAMGIAAKANVEGAKKINVIGRRDFEELKERFPESVEYFRFDLNGEAREVMKQTDILINATSLGMRGTDDDFTDFAFIKELPRDALVCDLVYEPKITELVRAASNRGIKAMNGLSMLIYQGLLADEIFLEREIEKESLFEEIYNTLNI